MTASLGARAQNAVVGEHELKAAYLYHFIQFTEWPPAVLADSAALQVCINPNSSLLQAVLALDRKSVHRKTINVKVGADEVSDCQIAIVSISERTAALNNIATRVGTLTISDDPKTSMDAAIIVMGVSEGRVVFSINNTKAHAAGLEISSKLLRLAGSVQ